MRLQNRETKYEFNNFRPPFIIKNGMLVNPWFAVLAKKIRPIAPDLENDEVILNKSILLVLGYRFEYDKFKKCECAKSPYMNLWWDSSRQSYYALTLNSRAYMKYLYEFQQWFIFLFCYKYKVGYNLQFLDAMVDLDRGLFKNLK
jgi:hypothetical protein